MTSIKGVLNGYHFYIQQTVGAAWMLNIRNHLDGSHKLERREHSNVSREGSGTKFLKRKPDHKRIMEGIGTKRKSSAHKNYYFPQSTLSEKQMAGDSISIFKSDSSKYISYKEQESNKTSHTKINLHKKLSTVKSDTNFNVRSKQNQQLKIAMLPENSRLQQPQQSQKIGQSSVSNLEDFQITPFLIDTTSTFNHKGVNNKKSMTQYFIQEQCYGSQPSESFKTEDNYELSISKEQKQFKKKKVSKADLQSIYRKNKWIQQNLDTLKQKQHLLETENKHLNEMVKQKDRVIDRLTRQKTMLNNRIKQQSQDELICSLEKVQLELRAQQHRIKYLKEQNAFLSTQLCERSQELIKVEEMYRVLENSFKEYQLKMIEKLEDMKTEVQRQKEKMKDQIVDFDSYGQLQRWKEKVFTQQEQLKYLRIQNQCLMVAKQQLQKAEQQRRKLKEERDYFKKKVLQNAKRMSRIQRQTSFQNSSLLFELSEHSIDV